MPRLVTKTAKAPLKVGDKYICMCGLSENQPFCDGSHKKTVAESDEKLYWYKSGSAEEVMTEPGECSGKCTKDDCSCDCQK